jgi:hypothetical protein
MGNSSPDKLRLAPQGNWSLHAQQPKARAAVAEVPLLDHAWERFTDGRRNVPSDVVHHRSPIECADLSRNNLVPRTLSPLPPFCRANSIHGFGNLLE